MKVLIYNDNCVDLEGPIHLKKDQRKIFEDFFRKNFSDDLDIIKIEEPIVEMEKEDVKIKKWTPSQIKVLLNTDSDAEAARKLNRNKWSVGMARAKYEPNIMAWAKERGYTIKEITKEKIKEAMKDIR